MPPIPRLTVAAGLAFLCASLLAGTAAGSQIIDRNARNVRLAVSPSGRTARLTYVAGGHQRTVLAWGAINAREPSRGRPQVQFRLDESERDGGFANACRPYDPKPDGLRWVVAGCRAPDGSVWAVQQWERLLKPGEAPGTRSAPQELHLSHWRGALAKFTVNLDWSYGGRYDHVWGWLSYRKRPVHGFASTPRGKPLDDYGRNVYLDTYNSSRGAGWRREAGFLTHRRTGGFCYLVRGKGEMYRAAISGPGVTPVLFWQGIPRPFDRERELQANEAQREFFAGSALCQPN